MSSMPSSRRCLPVVLFATAVCLLAGTPARADAQLYAAVYLGGNATHAATVSIDAPEAGLVADFRKVEFAARPLESPQYYGIRVGSLFGAARRIGVEFEFIHLKVYSETNRVYDIEWPPGTVVPAVVLPMDAYVQRYSMSHGLNFLLINVVSRTPIGDGRAAFIARAGAGPTRPHSESVVLNQTQEQYEYAGMGAHASAGIDVRLRGRMSLMTEYKFTYAKPRITLAAGGRGQTTAASHHVAVGLAFNISR